MIPEQDAANVVMQYAYKGGEVALKITGAAAKNLALLLLSLLQEKNRVKGRVMLRTLIQQGTPLLSFPLPKDKMDQFKTAAKQHGVMYAFIAEKGKDKASPSIDVIAKQNDVALLKKIFDGLGLGELPISARVDVKHITPELHNPDIPTAVDPEIAAPLTKGRREAVNPSGEKSNTTAEHERSSVRGYFAKIAAAKNVEEPVPLESLMLLKDVPVRCSFSNDVSIDEGARFDEKNKILNFSAALAKDPMKLQHAISQKADLIASVKEQAQNVIGAAKEALSK